MLGAATTAVAQDRITTFGDLFQVAREIAEEDGPAIVGELIARNGVRFVNPDAQRTLDALCRELHPLHRARRTSPTTLFRKPARKVCDAGAA
jgi:hypothetical protein